MSEQGLHCPPQSIPVSPLFLIPSEQLPQVVQGPLGAGSSFVVEQENRIKSRENIDITADIEIFMMQYY